MLRRASLGVAAVTCMVAAACLSVVTAADYYNEIHPDWSAPPLLLGPLTPNLQLTRAAWQLQRGDRDGAEQRAAEVLKHEPANQTALRLLGTIAAAREDDASSGRWFLLAAQQGWRDAPTQAYWYEQSLRLSDFAAAAQRAEALLRTRQDLPFVRERLPALEAVPQGRGALVDRILAVPDWPTAALADTAGLSDAQFGNRLALLGAVAAAGGSLDPRAVRRLSAEALGRGRAGDARRLWTTAFAPADPQALVFDGGFEIGPAAAGPPFGWRLPKQIPIEAAIALAPGELSGSALHLTARRPGRAAVARQSLVLSPGAYRLTWREAGRGLSVTPDVKCRGSTSFPVRQTGAASEEVSFILTVPDRPACASPDLALIAYSADDRSEAWLDDVRLVPLGRHPGN